MSFIDEANVRLISGRGGDGAATFHREKHVPRGGPNGADGGRGGHITLLADRNKRTLYDFKLRAEYKADDGSKAVGNKAGKDAKDITIRVPVGTVVTDAQDGELIVDLAVEGMQYVICKGGRGGRGNLYFTNSVRQSPQFAQMGAPGDLLDAKLELKLLADVGLIGLPNAGKSTLLSVMSSAKPKIADYPFTTLSPQLGVVTVGDHTFVMADLPGLIEGASEGIGLGHEFLRHAERNKVLLHVIDAYPIDDSDPVENFKMIEAELKQYSEEMWERPRIIALNKSDMGIPEAEEDIVNRLEKFGYPIFIISAATSQGLDPLKWSLWQTIEKAMESESSVPILVPTYKNEEDSLWDIEQSEEGFTITGKRIERLVVMTNLDNRDAVHYLYRKLKRIGVIEKLEDMGAVEGDTVWIGDFEFSYAGW
ncbi:MAG: GTPase ObgE [Fimbriimonadaceae bacterium]|nr:GTPase ObgE [Fimbriimonadaceae bacterium]